jgi:type II secretory pathway component PulJ
MLKAGHTLLEVLIALMLISTSFFSYMMLFRKMSIQLEDQYFLNIAMNQLFSLHERLMANHDALQRSREFNDWNTENKFLLPEGKGEFYCYRQECHLKIMWKYKTQKKLNMNVFLH